MLSFVFLGTGTSTGVPVLTCECEVCSSIDYRDKRLRSSVLVKHNQTQILIDSGPDFRQQMLRLDSGFIDGIVYTHEHKDHTAGLDDVRPLNYLSGEKKPISIYGRPTVLNQLKREYSYIFTDSPYPGIPLINMMEIENKPFEIKDTILTPIEVMHHKLPVYGYRIGDFTYITDANFISKEEKEKIKGSKVLVLNALQRKAHISHFNLEEAVDMALELGAEMTYFTHIGHRLGKHIDVEKELPSNIKLAYDGLEVKVS